MADKPFIAARLRNPAEGQPAAKPEKAPAKADWIGLVAAVVALVLAGVTLYYLKDEYSMIADYFTQIKLPL